MPAAATQEPKSEVTLRVRCRHCDRVQTRRGRSGIWWRCKHEDCRAQPHGGLNPGPLMEAAVMAPRALQRQRRRRGSTTDAGAAGQPAPAPTARNAEGPEGHVQGVAAPASVSRRTRRAPSPVVGEGTPSTPATPSPPAAAGKVSWFDRHVLGIEDE